jgi:hypothetical protein
LRKGRTLTTGGLEIIKEREKIRFGAASFICLKDASPLPEGHPFHLTRKRDRFTQDGLENDLSVTEFNPGHPLQENHLSPARLKPDLCSDEAMRLQRNRVVRFHLIFGSESHVEFILQTSLKMLIARHISLQQKKKPQRRRSLLIIAAFLS